MKMAGQPKEMGRRQDLEIASLSSKMETMAFEFADMLKDGLNCQLSGVFVIFFSDGESTLVDDWWWKKCPIFQQGGDFLVSP